MQWIARFQLDPPLTETAKKQQIKVDTMTLLKGHSKVLVQKKNGYDIANEHDVGVRFLLMDYLPGIVAMDADGGWVVHHGEVASHRKAAFHQRMAELQVCLRGAPPSRYVSKPGFWQVAMVSMRFPKIRSTFLPADGSYDVGASPGLGGAI
jgi:hypothetical protein